MSKRPGGDPIWPSLAAAAGRTQGPNMARRQARWEPRPPNTRTSGGAFGVAVPSGGNRLHSDPGTFTDHRDAHSRAPGHPHSEHFSQSPVGPTSYTQRQNDNRVTNLRYCEYCGEANHRRNVCRFGMPVMCFICKREGHKQKFCKHYHFWGDGKEEGRTSTDVLTNLPNEIILSISATETENTSTCNGKHVPPHKIGLDAIPTTSEVCGVSTPGQYPTKVPPERMASGCDTDLFKDVSDFRLKFKSNFIFAHVNINSYRHKFAQIQDLLRKISVDLLAISETKLDDTFPNAQFYVDGFTVYRQDKSSTSGGLLIYVRSDIAHRRVTRFECNADGVESLCIEFIIGKSKSVAACIYKHPRVKDSLFLQKMTHIADALCLNYDDYFFLGDMNCAPNKSNVIKILCDTYNLKNLITSPTCHKGQHSTLIDVVLVSNPKKYAGVLNCECAVSDFHNFVGAATKRFAPLYQPRVIYYRSYNHFDDDIFVEHMSSIPFHVAEIFDDVDDMSWFTSKLLLDTIEEHAPVRCKKIKCESVPYMNYQLRKAIYRRNMARNKYKKYGHKYWEENRRERNNVVALRKKSYI